MSTYARIKQTVTTRQAAQMYGLPVNRSGMTKCPFHEDHNPSMKVDDRFYCFGCHATGDVIDFTAKLFGISIKDAAKKLAEDFGIDSKVPTQSDIPNLRAEPSHDRERLCICVLREYLRHLRIWQLRYHPEKPGDPIHPRFAEAMRSLPTVNHLLDCLLGNDLLLAKETAEVLCWEGHIQRLSEYLGTLSEKERDCA